MPRTAFLFPGQGSQSIGMASAVVQASLRAQQLFDQAKQILGYDLLDICLHGPRERLDATDVSQPAIFVASLAALESLRDEDPRVEEPCVATAGLSLGEYTSLVFAGALTFADGLWLVHQRGQAMQAAAEANRGAMLSVLGLDLETLEQLCQQARTSGWLSVANRLCPGNLVVSGTVDACSELVGLAEAQGARTVRLSVAGAFHTPLMRPADEHLAKALAAVPLQAPQWPVWSNVDAKPHRDPEEIRQLLVQQVLQPVLWEDTMRGMLASGVDQFREIGPGRVLAGLLKRIDRRCVCLASSA